VTQHRHAINLALSCYPGWWRERYGEEVQVHAADMVADGRSPMALSVSLLWGAAKARWSARGMPRDYRVWAMRNRVSIAVATLSSLVTVLLLPVVFGVFDNDQVGGWGFAPAVTIMNYCSLVIAVLSIVTLLLVIVGWARLVYGIWRSSTIDRRRTLWWASVPGVVATILMGGLIIEFVLQPDFVTTETAVSGHLASHSYYVNGDLTAAHALGTGLAIGAVAGLVLSIVSVLIVATKTDVDFSVLRFGTRLSTAVAVLLCPLFAAAVVWGVGLIIQAREAAHGRFSPIAYSGQRLGLCVVLLCIGITLSVASARRARKSWKVLAGGMS
jgi:hypothetical protein